MHPEEDVRFRLKIQTLLLIVIWLGEDLDKHKQWRHRVRCRLCKKLVFPWQRKKKYKDVVYGSNGYYKIHEKCYDKKEYEHIGGFAV